MQKIIAFFKRAQNDYSGVPRLEKQAKRYYKQFKKWFDEFAAERTYKTINSTAYAESTNADTDTSFALSKGKAERLKNDLVKLGTLGIRLDAGGKSIRILTDKFTQNKNIFSNKGRNMREVNARIKAIPHFTEILRSCTYEGSDTEIHGLENEAKKVLSLCTASKALMMALI